MDITAEIGLDCLRQMVVIRAVEEAICEEYPHRNIRGAVHLSIGEEASAVGVLSTCRADDKMVSTHRDHAHYLAKGGSLAGMVDELYGLPTGCSGGHGGSMHLCAPDAGFMGASAVLPGSMPVAVGLGFAAKRLSKDAIAIAFSGDGAADEGVFYEALNLAAILAVPVLFVCENNELSTNTWLRDRQAQPDIAAKAAAFGVGSRRVAGHDVFAVRHAAAEMIAAMRIDRQPALLEVKVARLCAHVGPVSKVPAIDAEAMLDASHRGDIGDDPILHCLEQLIRKHPESEAACLDILTDVPVTVRAEFRRGHEAFEAHNLVHQLVAPPPPKSYAV